MPAFKFTHYVMNVSIFCFFNYMDIWGQCTDCPPRTFTFLVRKCVARWYICHLCFVLQYMVY
jgi:hypothetical protein